jgi:hypothetical protein
MVDNVREAAEKAIKQKRSPAREYLDVVSSISLPDLVSGRACWFGDFDPADFGLADTGQPDSNSADKGLADNNSIATGQSNIDPRDIQVGQADTDLSD